MKKLLLTSAAAALLAASSTAYAKHPGEGGEGHQSDKKHHGQWMFKKMDSDADGTISRAEFDAHHAKKFGEMDKDGNGSISDAEAKAYSEAKREKWQERHEGMQEKRSEMRKGMDDKAFDAMEPSAGGEQQ